MKIFLSSSALKSKIKAAEREAAQIALRQWHRVFVFFARVDDETVHLFESVERRFVPNADQGGQFEFRTINALAGKITTDTNAQ